MNPKSEKEREMMRLMNAKHTTMQLVDKHLEEIRNTENVEKVVDKYTSDIPIDVKHLVIDSLEHMKEELEEKDV